MTDDVKKTWTMRMIGLDRFVKAGDSVRDKFEIINFSHGIYAEPVTAGNPRRVMLYDISIVRETDAATPVLMRLCQTGDALPQVFIELRVEKDGKEIYSFTYELINARITRMNTSGSSHGTDYRLYEDLGLSFEKIRSHVKDGETRGSAELTPPAP